MRVLDEEVFITILAMLRLGHYTAGNFCVYVCVCVCVCGKNVDVMQNLQ